MKKALEPFQNEIMDILNDCKLNRRKYGGGGERGG